MNILTDSYVATAADGRGEVVELALPRNVSVRTTVLYTFSFHRYGDLGPNE